MDWSASLFKYRHAAFLVKSSIKEKIAGPSGCHFLLPCTLFAPRGGQKHFVFFFNLLLHSFRRPFTSTANNLLKQKWEIILFSCTIILYAIKDISCLEHTNSDCFRWKNKKLRFCQSGLVFPTHFLLLSEHSWCFLTFFHSVHQLITVLSACTQCSK